MSAAQVINIQSSNLEQHRPTRIASIDLFRGITMAIMIFVNTLAGVHGLPWWNYHAEELNCMTYPDFVFPFFLFAIGLSLPLAIEQRLKRNPSYWALARHVIERFLALLTLGMILANAEYVSRAHTGLSGIWWAILALLSASCYLLLPPKSPRWQLPARILRYSGLAGVLILLAIFRRVTPDGNIAWLDWGYPEILGLIAFSYLGAAILFIPLRKFKLAAPALALLMLLLCIATAAHWFSIPLPLYEWPFNNGSMCCLIFFGAFISQLFTNGKASTKRMRATVALGITVILAGWLLAPLGISKIRATPTWVLWSAGAAILLYVLLYYVADIKNKTAWARPFHAAGANTLTTYLLPDLWEYITMALGLTFYDTFARYGFPAILKTIAFTALILLFASLLTKARIRLQL